MGSTESNFNIGLRDVVRVGKYSISGNGIRFLGSQLLLQGMNPFNETKLYNPLMPVVAATSLADFGLTDSPTRFIEPNLGGVLGALGLSSISSLFGVGGTPTPPKGTVGASALAKASSDGGKGLSRGQSATIAYKQFQTKWPANTRGGGSFLSNAIGAVAGFLQANTAVGTFFPVGQPAGSTYKAADTKIYGTMLNNTSNLLFSMARLDTSDNSISYDDGGIYIQKYSAGAGIGGNPGSTYEDIVYVASTVDNEKSPLLNLELPAFTTATDNTYPSNYNNKNDQSITDTLNQLNSLLDVVSKNGYTTLSANYIATNYLDLASIKSQQDGDTKSSPFNYNNSGRVLSYSKAMRGDINLLTNKGLDTNSPDSVNLYGPLSSSAVSFSPNNDYTSTKYDPYRSDIIAFYFHDIINDIYLPFRATMKGIQESLQATWTDVKYINRADKIYAYGGFSRTLNFTFFVNISSIKELLPSWKRINYLAGLVKPANYTDGTVYSRVAIPPMIDFTIGDMYKKQPALITQIGITVPDDASWETLSENGANNPNQADDSVWQYGRVQWYGPQDGQNNAKGYYAQFPMQCEISINLNLLEKEMPRAGGANYGDYYLDQNFNAVGSSPGQSFSANLYASNVNGNLPTLSNTTSSIG